MTDITLSIDFGGNNEVQKMINTDIDSSHERFSSGDISDAFILNDNTEKEIFDLSKSESQSEYSDERLNDNEYHTNNNAFEFPFIEFTSTVHVNFPYNTIMDIKQLPVELKFEHLRRLIAKDCNESVKNIKLSYNKKAIKNSATPKDLFINLLEEHDLKCHVKHPSVLTKIHLGSRKIKLTEQSEISVYIHKGVDPNFDRKPDILEVMLSDKAETNIFKSVEINWLERERHKPFLGGYKSKLDNTVYHNASAQSNPKHVVDNGIEKYHRNTQTYRMAHFTQDTPKPASTGMTKVGFYYNNTNDKLISPSDHYETADEYEARVLRMTIIIQTHVRRWLAKRRVNRLRTLRDAYNTYMKEEERRAKAERDGRFDMDYERRLHPKSRADFDRLFDALEQWRKDEVVKIYSTAISLADRKAKMGLLIDREIELIAAISCHQIELSKCGRMRELEHMFEAASASKRWTAVHDTNPVEKDTPETLRAKELLCIYDDLKTDCLTDQERLDLLLTVKDIVRQYPSKLSCNLISLVEREAELIVRHVSGCMLQGLRIRILQRFVQFCKNRDYNPGIANFLPVPNPKIPESKPNMWKDTHVCKSCGRYQRTKEFNSSARSNVLGPCLFCRRQANRGRARIDLEPYRLILVELRANEARLLLDVIEAEKKQRYQEILEGLDKLTGDDVSNGSVTSKSEKTLTESELNPETHKIELLVDVNDIYHLVNEVWENKSALSGCDDITELTVCRWQVDEPWAPWNMLVLTREEAKLHYTLKSIPLKELYADALLRRVRQRLVMAKNTFTRLCPTGNQLTYERKFERLIARNPQNSMEWRQGQRRKLRDNGVPLYILSVEDRHRPTMQPPKQVLPIIRGEKTMSDVEITSLKEIWTL